MLGDVGSHVKVWGLGFRVWGFRVSGLGWCEVQSSWLRQAQEVWEASGSCLEG